MLFSLFAAALAAAASPLPPTLLQVLTLNERSTTYEVNIPNCATFGHRLVRVKIRELGGWSRISSLRLTYADRRYRMIALQRNLRPGEETPWIDLAVHGHRDNRCLAYLSLEGSASQPRYLTQVQIFGLSENTAGQ